MSTRTISKTISLDSFPGDAASKYITKINNTGIKIHPEVYNGSSAAEKSSYIQLDGTGMELFNSNGDSIAKYGEDIRLGSENEGKLLITSGGVGHTYEVAGTYIISGSDNVLARFLASGAQVGQSGGAHSVIDVNGQRFYASDGTTQLANIGYGETTGDNGTIDAPFYTFGVRGTASNYDPTTTYSVDELCVYNGILYMCIEAITTPEAWDSTKWVRAVGSYSMVEGYNAIASRNCSHAEGYNTKAIGNCSHAEGYKSEAISFDSHAEGYNTKVNGMCSHAEGYESETNGNYAHAQNQSTKANGNCSHAEGYKSEANVAFSHAEGYNTKTNGYYSHAQNEYTIASKRAQTALGTYNDEDTSATTTHPSGTAYYGQYAVIVGNGTANNARSNALTVDWDGKVSLNNAVGVSSNKAYINILHSRIDSNGATPTTTVYSNNLHSFDVDGTRIGYIESFHNTDGEICINIGASRLVNGSMVYNSITSKVSASGAYGYSITSPVNFRKAIRLKDAISFQTATSTNNSYTAGQVKTITITNGAVKSGCTAIAIRGWNLNNSSSGGANASGINVFSCMISGNDIVVETKNNASSAAKVDIYVYVTFIENY